MSFRPSPTRLGPFCRCQTYYPSVARLFQYTLLVFPRVLNPRRSFTAATKRLISDRPLEEEALPGYDADEFYPVHIGDVLNGKYQVLGKPGYGTSSTVWLGRGVEYDGLTSVQYPN